MLQLFLFIFLICSQLNNEFIIDFSGKYLKSATYNSSSSLSFLQKGNISNSQYLIPNSISASVIDCMKFETSQDAISIGNSAFQKVRQNVLFGIEFLGAIFNRKKSYLRNNYKFFLTDENVTLTSFPIFWYLEQFFIQYQNLTNSSNTTLILPGYSTDFIFDQLQIANNHTFETMKFFKDYEIIQKVHSKLSTRGKSILYIDFGAFSTKATLINNLNQVISYSFDEECGIEKVAYRLASQNEPTKNSNSKGGNLTSIQRTEAYKIIEGNNSFSDIDFYNHLKTLIEQVSIQQYESVIILGGGCNIPFVTESLKKIITNVPIYLSDDYMKLNHSTFFVEAYHLTRNTNANNTFIYHPLYLKYGSNIHKLTFNSIQQINLGKVLTRPKTTKHNETINNTYDNRITIITDENHVLNGGSKIYKKLIIPDLNNETFNDVSDKDLIITFSPNMTESFEMKFEAKLCDSGDSSKCSHSMALKTSDSISRKALRVAKKAREADAAMTMIRLLMKRYSSKKKDSFHEL